MDFEYQAAGIASPYWLLKMALSSRVGRLGGWLARLHLQHFADLPYDGVPGEWGDEDDADPYDLLTQALEAKGRGELALAMSYLARINRIYGEPPFTSTWELREALEIDGFVKLVMIDTGLGMPGGECIEAG
jgi:hypothetical protein